MGQACPQAPGWCLAGGLVSRNPESARRCAIMLLEGVVFLSVSVAQGRWLSGSAECRLQLPLAWGSFLSALVSLLPRL